MDPEPHPKRSQDEILDLTKTRQSILGNWGSYNPSDKLRYAIILLDEMMQVAARKSGPVGPVGKMEAFDLLEYLLRHRYETEEVVGIPGFEIRSSFRGTELYPKIEWDDVIAKTHYNVLRDVVVVDIVGTDETWLVTASPRARPAWETSVMYPEKAGPMPRAISSPVTSEARQSFIDDIEMVKGGARFGGLEFGLGLKVEPSKDIYAPDDFEFSSHSIDEF